MKILILGASTKSSIGYQVGERLRVGGHTPVYASRSGALGHVCDLTDPEAVKKLFITERPDAVIYAAGIFVQPAELGKIKDGERVREHLAAKSLGAVIALGAAVMASAKLFIVVGGRELSAEPAF